MEINKYSPAVSAYKINGYDIVKKDMSAPSPVLKNCDKAEFSSFSSAKPLEKAKLGIKSKIDEFIPQERIESLKSMIADGSYCIPADIVAVSMFEG